VSSVVVRASVTTVRLILKAAGTGRSNAQVVGGQDAPDTLTAYFVLNAGIAMNEGR